MQSDLLHRSVEEMKVGSVNIVCMVRRKDSVLYRECVLLLRVCDQLASQTIARLSRQKVQNNNLSTFSTTNPLNKQTKVTQQILSYLSKTYCENNVDDLSLCDETWFLVSICLKCNRYI